MKTTAMRMPTYFSSHGGGPWPWLQAEMPGVYDNLEKFSNRHPATEE